MCSVTWLCCSNMLPLRGEQQATDENLAKSIDISVIKVIEAMKAKEQLLTIYPQVLENIRATDKSFVQNDPDVQKAIQSEAEALGDTGRILVRESGTEPLVQVMVESPGHSVCQKYVSQVVETIKSKGCGV
ncbi:MAG: hypothetical protein KH706_00725 [Faecalibacterium prausnitzii]|nr:hypothetical protein [Faecalibacterium prausnitzii]